jgi:hypothetical protein
METPAPIQEPIVAAVVRSDGLLAPFAVYENGAWHGPEVGGGETITGLSSAWFAGRLDALRDWRLVTPLGLADLKGDPIPLQATGAPVEAGSHCERVWALPTDLPAQPVRARETPQIVGIAVSRAVPSQQVAMLAPTPPETAKALAFLQPHFDSAEARESARRASNPAYAARPSGAAAAKDPLSFTHISRVGGQEGQSIYLFEAVRTYAGPVERVRATCDDASVMTGWFVEDAAGEFRLLDGTLTMTDCDFKGSARVQPVAMVTLGDRSYVITLERHYEGETYSITEVSAAAVRPILTVYGGGC